MSYRLLVLRELPELVWSLQLALPGERHALLLLRHGPLRLAVVLLLRLGLRLLLTRRRRGRRLDLGSVLLVVCLAFKVCFSIQSVCVRTQKYQHS